MDAFKEEIESAVEKVITKKLKTAVSLLDTILQTLPKQVPVDDVASLNVTFVDNPFFSDTSVGFEINGLFIENKTDIRSYNKYNHLQPSIHCSDPSKMVGIALDEAVFESAFALYYNVTPQIPSFIVFYLNREGNFDPFVYIWVDFSYVLSLLAKQVK